MKYLQTMVRISDLDDSIDFYCARLGLKGVRRDRISAIGDRAAVRLALIQANKSV